jgi:transposase
MLSMDQYDMIRTSYRIYGEGIKEIARRTGHSRNTIRKALRHQFARYTPRSTQPYPVLGAYVAIIDSWLEKDRDQPRKQRHTAERVFQRLVAEHGYGGSVSTVRKYVREAKLKFGLKASPVSIPLDPDPGQEAEVDWGQAYAVIAGELERLHYICIRSKGSGKPFVRYYLGERQQALFDALMYAFLFFGGVFRILIFDNMKTVVLRILRGREREEQERFQQFRSYYNFEARFCNPESPNEKGGVEGLVGFVRRNFLTPVPEVDSLEELNERVLAQCISYGQRTVSGREKTVQALFEEEKASLLPLPSHPYENIPPPVSKYPNKYSTIIIDRNRYSVPTGLASYPFRVICRVETLEFFSNGKHIVTHPRRYGCGKWQLDPAHYLDLIRRRPMAFDSARPIRQWREHWPPVMEELLERFRREHEINRGTREFIDVLLLFRDHTAEAVEAAVRQGLLIGARDSASIRHLLYSQQPTPPVAPLECYAQFPDADVSAYDELGGVQ